MLPKIIKTIVTLMAFMAAAGMATYLTVHLLIRSDNSVVVPDLSGKEVVYGLELLSDIGLNTKIKSSNYSDTVPKHHIIAQDPAPGTELKKGRDVRLTISKGTPTVVIPNFAGTGFHQISIFLAENGLRQGQLTYFHTGERPYDEVLAQYPPPGAITVRGETVDLLISAGPAMALMPMIDLKGLDLGQAMEVLEHHHLVVNTIQSVSLPGPGNDTVMDHAPAAGYPVAMDSGVDLMISRKERQSAERRDSSLTFFRYTLNEGFLKTHIKVRISSSRIVRDIFDDFVKPGRQIWLLIPRDQPTTLLLYADDELIKNEYFD